MDKPKTQRKPRSLVSKESIVTAFNNKVQQVIDSEMRNIERVVKETMKQAISKMVGNTLGLKSRYSDDWELDDSENGQQIVDMINKAAGDRIQSTVEEFLTTIDQEKIKKKVFAAMTRRYNEIYEESLLSAVEDVARDMARRDAAEFMKETPDGDTEKQNEFF